MGYVDQHYVPAFIAGTDVWDPRTINYHGEMIKSEFVRLGAALFGAYDDPTAHVHWVTDPFYPGSQVQSPALLIRMVDMLDDAASMASKPGIVMEESFSSVVGGDDDYAAWVRSPDYYKIILEASIVQRGEYPFFDLETKLKSVVQDVFIEIYGAQILLQMDSPPLQTFSPNDSRLRMFQLRISYAGVPFYKAAAVAGKTGLMEDISMFIYNKTTYDEFDIKEDIR